MQRAVSVTAVLGLVLLPGCGSSRASDTAVEETLERGVAQIGAPQTTKQLHDDLVRTLATLRTQRASTATSLTAKRLAIEGFSWTLRGVGARLEITTNDSGNLEASVHDAKRADRGMRRGTGFLRASGRPCSRHAYRQPQRLLIDRRFTRALQPPNTALLVGGHTQPETKGARCED